MTDETYDWSWLDIHGVDVEAFEMWMQNAEKLAVLDESDEDDRERLENVDSMPEHELAASRMGYALAALRRKYLADITPFEDEIARLVERRDDLRERFQVRSMYLERQLELWHRAELDRDPSRTTIELPGVTLKSRKQRAKAILLDHVHRSGETDDGETVEYTVTGEEAFGEFVCSMYDSEDYPAWVNYKETWALQKNNMMRALKEGDVAIVNGRVVDWGTGAVLDWLTITQPTDLDRDYEAVTE